MRYRLANIEKGELVVDPKSMEVIDDFSDAFFRGRYNIPENDIAIDKDYIIVPADSRELFLGADPQSQKELIKVFDYKQKEARQYRSPGFEKWYSSATIEGQEKMDPYRDDAHYEYAKYYSDVVNRMPGLEQKRLEFEQMLPDEYMTEFHPFVTEQMNNQVNPAGDIPIENQINDDILKMGGLW